jgi:glutamine synthetase type III
MFSNINTRNGRVDALSDKIFCWCILLCTGNRKCNWYAGTITVNSELDSVSNDIYFLNMQLLLLCKFVLFYVKYHQDLLY